jgi:ABC-type multidrug transport system ATPase subunit
MLSIRDLVKVYPGPVAALQGVRLDIPPGMFGLLGPNGAGKSTLMRILAGLLEPTSGTAQLDGQEITSEPARVWSQLGYLPQDFGFYPNLTGEQMLEHLLALKGVESPLGTRKLVAELLERVNLAAAGKRKVKTYSGGMRQRLGIAQAIAGDPRLLIVDEPTAGLDPEERLRFYHLLAELAEGRIVLLSTHIVEDVSVLCPRFAILAEGRLVAETTPVEARTLLEGAIFEGSVEKGGLDALRARCHVTQSMLSEGRLRVRIWRQDGHVPPGFEPVRATLEDAYLVLTHKGRVAREEELLAGAAR